ncbi:hypothetical protein [Pediococcus stilesii]|uniref:Uncharacterized protein n=1 Tax=Pediococcus stilesii TaxID=331679 RepID=A0A5R9BRK3_9LACO|nr:hypothetical protein [Pediococcus stilesii]TLQ03358.1 hypothetical protein FEZ51_09755 [Pediococcus stilesii]
MKMSEYRKATDLLNSLKLAFIYKNGDGQGVGDISLILDKALVRVAKRSTAPKSIALETFQKVSMLCMTHNMMLNPRQTLVLQQLYDFSCSKGSFGKIDDSKVIQLWESAIVR